MSAGEECPLCKEKGHRRKLRKFSINFQESVLLCNNPKCTYPMGCATVERIIVAANGENVLKPGLHGRGLLNINSVPSSTDEAIPNVDSRLHPLTKLGQEQNCSKPRLNDVCAEQIDASGEQNGLNAQQNNLILTERKLLSDANIKLNPTETKLLSDANIKLNPAKQIFCLKVPDSSKIAMSEGTMSSSGQKASHCATVLNSSISGRGAPAVAGLTPVFSKTTSYGKAELLTGEERLLKCPVDRWLLQWENREALCWLDVVLCLLVQSQSIRKAIESKQSNSSDSKKHFLVHTLLSAYDQALTLSKSLLVECRERLKTEKKHQVVFPVQSGASTAKASIPNVHAAGEITKPASRLNPYLTQNRNMTTILSGEKGVPLKMGAGQTDCPFIPTQTSMAELVARNVDFCKARSILNSVRELVWEELQPKLRCEKGRKDSPVFAIPLLLHSDPDICHLFKTTYKFETRCNQCGNTKIERYTKVLPTLPKVVAEFSMSNICHLRDCFICKAPNQKRQLHFESLADCVMIHFVEGLPSSDLSALDFSLEGKNFHVSAVVQYKNEPSHFVIWIKHSSGDSWMECDDLKGPLCKFSQSRPNLPASQIHIVFWERDKTIDMRTNRHSDSQTTAPVEDKYSPRYPLIGKQTVDCSGEVTPKRLITSGESPQVYMPLPSTHLNGKVYAEAELPTPRIVTTEYKPKSSVLKKNYLLLKQMNPNQASELSNIADIKTPQPVANRIEASELRSNIADIKTLHPVANRKAGYPGAMLETAARINKVEKDPISILKLKASVTATKFAAYKSKKDVTETENQRTSAESVSTKSPSYPNSVPDAPLTESSSSVRPNRTGKRRKAGSGRPNKKHLHTETDSSNGSTKTQPKDRGENFHGTVPPEVTGAGSLFPNSPSVTGTNSLGVSKADVLNHTELMTAPKATRAGNSEPQATRAGNSEPQATRAGNSDLTYSLFADIDLTDLGFCNTGSVLMETEVTNSVSYYEEAEVKTGDSTLSEADILQDLYKALDITAPEIADINLIDDIFT